ncbi:restriction endonuclease subunit S [Haloferax volcanii]|uniref:Restriction endonuclease subunit S n=1 Tax=Haloferax volcanii TaxID=2246 RepID=A0A558GBM8_HALVO|nr:restriction endonuclease subunit S [Haloferax volcanii]TVT95146.1 restriction endonuclease subunit S [Haloferax volcanii]
MRDQTNIGEFVSETQEGTETEKVRLKHLARINPSKSEVSELDADTEVSFVALEDFGTDGEIKNTETRKLEDVYNGYTYFREGDIAIAKITPSFENGKGAICRGLKNGVGFGTTELHIVRPREGVSTEFLWYALRSKPFVDEAETSMRGVAGQQRVPTEFLENFKIEEDALSEQTQRVKILEKQIPTIDRSIRKTGELIKKINSRKPQKILSKILQSGEGTSKNSKNIDWLTSVPEEFEETRLKYVTDSIIDSEHKTAPEKEGEYRIIRTTDVRDGKIKTETAKTTTEEVYEEWTSRATPEPGDLIFTREAPAGEVGVIKDGPNVLLGQRTVLLKFSEEKIRPEYLNYYLQTDIVDWFIQRSSQGSTVEHLNVSDLKEMPILLPNLDVQDSVIAEMNRTENVSENVIDSLQRIQSLLEEKRQALITAAVTGQIDVTETQTPDLETTT